MKEIFTTIQISNGTTLDIYEGTGLEFFIALSVSQGKTGALIKSLISQLVYVKGKLITETEIDDLPIKDASYLTEVISTMLSNNYIGGL
jgi:hypothetical protein